jgi:hypothetical protein
MAPTVIASSSVRPAVIVGPESYKSRMLERYLGFLAKSERPHILDLGPICGSSIDFYLRRCSRLSVCDIMGRFYHNDHKSVSDQDFLSLLDYPKKSFDSIHLWDIADHLETELLTELVDCIVKILRPNGVIMMLANNQQAPQTRLNYFIPGVEATVTLKQTSLCPLPYFFRSNRDLEIDMKPLELQTSFICLNGIREFLFKR